MTIDKYKELIKQRIKDNPRFRTLLRRGYNKKMRILAFFERKGRWPRRTDTRVIFTTATERTLAMSFENYMSKEAKAYDADFRALAMSISGRKTNNKRKHNVKEFKNEILQFLATHGRVPSTSYEYQTVEGEAKLRHKLDYYTNDCGDMTLLGEIYSVDKCHKSGIPVKYRRLINQAIEVEKPLVRLSQTVLKGEE